MRYVRIAAMLAVCWFVGNTLVCRASGPRTVTFDQVSDCTFITGWELAYEPMATAGALPSATALGFSATNISPLVCGIGAKFAYSAIGVGQYRFWLRAVASDGTKSAYSNTVDAPLPFAAPHLVSVGS
jgi:hypothetical protein